MKISYPQREETYRQRKGMVSAQSSSHLTFIATLIVAIVVVAFVAWWFALRSAQRVEVPAPVIPTREEALQEFSKPPLNVDDALTQCETSYPLSSDAVSRQGRVRCYAAVMVLWNTTGPVCESPVLDAEDTVMCNEAIAMVETFGENPSSPSGQSQNLNSPTSQGNTNSVSLHGGGSAVAGGGSNLNAPPPGFINGGGSNGNSNADVTSNTNFGSGVEGNSNNNTNAPPEHSGLEDDNGLSSPPSTNDNTAEPPQEPLPSPSETAEEPSTEEPTLCVDESGEIVLLQHTETCQF